MISLKLKVNEARFEFNSSQTTILELREYSSTGSEIVMRMPYVEAPNIGSISSVTIEDFSILGDNVINNVTVKSVLRKVYENEGIVMVSYIIDIGENLIEGGVINE
ncbi:MAG: hypothetical protein ACRC5T_05265 [Cetobacterium sp.]